MNVTNYFSPMPDFSGDLVSPFSIQTSTNSNILSEDEKEYWEGVLWESRYAVQKILVPIVLIIGTFGNSITIAVLTRRHMQTSTNLYLTALAISDILYLVFIFSLSLKHSPGMSHFSYWFYWHYYRYALWLTDASSSTSLWLTVTFTVERYIAVCHPMKGKVFCTQSRAKRVILLVYLLCFLLTITTPHEWIVVPDPATNGTHLTLSPSDLGSNSLYIKGFYWFSAVTFIIIPLILLAAFNTFLILAVKKSKKQRTAMTNSCSRDNASPQENKITVMLIAVVLLAIVCQMPTATMLIYTSFHEIKQNTVELYVCTILNNYFNWLTGVNAAVNFIFYCALSDRYRKTFLRTVCRKWSGWQSPTPSWVGGTTAYSNFEDGSSKISFRGFMRNASMRMSRRSSHKSSSSTTPKASPSGSSFRGLERQHLGGSFLSVPPQRGYGAHLRHDETVTEVPLRQISWSRSPSERGRLSRSPLLNNGSTRKQSLQIQRFSPDEDLNVEQSFSSEILKGETRILADTEIVPRAVVSRESPEPRGRRDSLFPRLLKALHIQKQPAANGSTEAVGRPQTILIKCQTPSLEDQTAV